MTNFKGVVNLRVLILSKNQIKFIGEIGHLANALETLDLHDNLLTGDFKFTSSGIRDLKSLKNLNLSGNQIETVELDTSISNPEESSETFKNLVEINFRGNKIKEFKLGPLSAAYGYQLENLQRIFLSNNCLQNLHEVHAYSYKDQGISQDLLIPSL
jgi:Leucine-rich repeat (LRR) protein